MAHTPEERAKAQGKASSARDKLSEEEALFAACEDKQSIGGTPEGEYDGKSMVTPPLSLVVCSVPAIDDESRQSRQVVIEGSFRTLPPSDPVVSASQIVLGGGLVGCLCAAVLCKKGFEVIVIAIPTQNALRRGTAGNLIHPALR